MSASLPLGYVAGVLSTLSPCVLPILPIVLVGAIERHVLAPLALAAGLAMSFAATGIAIASIGLGIGIDQSVLRLMAAVLIGVVGVVLLVPAAQTGLARLAAPLAARAQTRLDGFEPSGIGGQFILGALLGAVWSPCTGPTLGAVVGLAAQGDSLGAAAGTMAAFAVGAATPIVALAYGSRHAILVRRDWLAHASRMGKPLMGVIFLSLGIFVLTGLDKIVETSLTRAMPDWLVTVTTRL